MNHDSYKNYFEYLIKNILQYYNLIDKDLHKSERPDFRNDDVGLEVTRADLSLPFNGFTSKYNKNNITDIKKYNNGFIKNGGRVFKKTDPIVKVLNLHNTLYDDKDYVYINPVYPNNFDFINKKINDKLVKLNSIYDNIKHYYLAIFTTVYVHENNIKEELDTIIELQSQFLLKSNCNRKFEKIVIIFIDKICEFNLLNNTYKIIENTAKELKNISEKTCEQLKKL